MLSSHEVKLSHGVSDPLPQRKRQWKKAAMEEIKHQLKQNRSSKSGTRGVLAEAYSERGRETV